MTARTCPHCGESLHCAASHRPKGNPADWEVRLHRCCLLALHDGDHLCAWCRRPFNRSLLDEDTDAHDEAVAQR